MFFNFWYQRVEILTGTGRSIIFRVLGVEHSGNILMTYGSNYTRKDVVYEYGQGFQGCNLSIGRFVLLKVTQDADVD